MPEVVQMTEKTPSLEDLIVTAAKSMAAHVPTALRQGEFKEAAQMLDAATLAFTELADAGVRK